jgi:hypothetical protein
MSHFLHAGRILIAMLREVFDEAAYARFLKSANLQSSRSAYAAFCRERESIRARAVKCC